MTPLGLTRQHRELAAALLLTAGFAWWWTAERMAGMDAAPGAELGTLGWFTASWVVMMAAMMLPSFAPTLATYVSSRRGRENRQWLLFTCGYLLVWAVAGLTAYGIFALGNALLGNALAWHHAGRWVSATAIVAAAAYEFIPLKQACLERCRGQLGDAEGAPRQLRPAALALGAHSGVWCIGCSWALMVALFALGVMSLTWMALIAALIALEKVGPWPRGAKLATSAILLALAAGILVAPHAVPGLVVPAPGEMHAMNAMG